MVHIKEHHSPDLDPPSAGFHLIGGGGGAPLGPVPAGPLAGHRALPGSGCTPSPGGRDETPGGGGGGGGGGGVWKPTRANTPPEMLPRNPIKRGLNPKVMSVKRRKLWSTLLKAFSWSRARIMAVEEERLVRPTMPQMR